MKDYPNFLRAAALLARERRDVRFVCVGGGPDRYVREYRELSSALQLGSCLHWTGERNDLPDIYNAFDVMVLSSAYGEGFSNVLGEAMACGTPCVATDVGDAAQLIDTLGEVVPARDPEALKRGILTLLSRLESDKTKLKKEVEQRIANQFSVAKLVSRTVNLLEVVARKSANKEGSLKSDTRL
jgi:glycosyltransferase involved in cell wall biosynthesis